MLSIKTFHNVLLSTTGDVFDINGKSITSCEQRDIDVTQITIDELPCGVYYDCTHKMGLHVWGHFREVLSRFYYYRDEITCHDYVLVNKAHKICPQEHVDHFNMFGVHESKLIYLTQSKNTYYHVPTFKTVDRVPLYKNTDVLCFIRDTWLSSIKPEKGDQIKIYLKRSGYRGVINSREIDRLLISKNFKIFTGKEGFNQHVEMFSNASVIVGVHGAAFFNTIFCPPQVNILEFVPQSRKVKMWLNQSNAIGIC